MNSLQLLQTESKEQLQHNLRYIDRNKGTDFVAEALRPGGRSIENTVEFLYSAEENDNVRKVREIADFVSGFEGTDRMSDEEIGNLDFEDVANSIKRCVKSFTMQERFGCYSALTMLGTAMIVGVKGTLAFIGYHGLEQMDATDCILAGGSVIGLTIVSYLIGMEVMKLGQKLSKTIEGDQKPRYAYNSLLRKSAQADEFLQIYSIAEKVNYKSEQK